MIQGNGGWFIRNIAEVPWLEFPNHFGGALSKPLVMPDTAPTRRLDYVLVRDLEVLSVRVPNVRASDHRPVLATLAPLRGLRHPHNQVRKPVRRQRSTALASFGG